MSSHKPVMIDLTSPPDPPPHSPKRRKIGRTRDRAICIDVPQELIAGGNEGGNSDCSEGEEPPFHSPLNSLSSLKTSSSPSDRATYALLSLEASSLHDCPVCLERVPASAVVRLRCHGLCRDCFEGYCRSKIEEAAVSAAQLVCPMHGCVTPITVAEIRSVLPPSDVDKYERFKLREFASGPSGRAKSGRAKADPTVANETLVTCPSCNVYLVSVDLTEPHVVAWRSIPCGDPSCGFSFCGGCGLPPHRHPGRTTDETCEEHAKAREGRERGTEKARENEQNERLFEEYVEREGGGVRECPGCGVKASLAEVSWGRGGREGTE